MDMYPQYKSPLGYSTGDNKIDAYGVDHSGFSTRDELEYQFARQNKENQLIQNYNNQGITKNYPQYGTNFWGNSDNNYGFGSSKIHNNIENMQNQSNLGNSNNTQWGMNNEQPNNINSGYGQTNTQPQTYNIFGNNNALQNTPNLAQGLNLGASAALYPQQNSFNTYSQPYQLAQNSLPNTGSDVGNIVKANINFDDVYYSELGEDGNVIYQGTNKHEGGYSDRLNDLGGPTNYGVRQAALNEYLYLWNDPIKKGGFFPTKVENLTPKQAKQIMYEMYYQRYNINKLQNLQLARNTFDAEVNQGTDAGKMLSRAMNEFYGYQKGDSQKYFYENQVLNDMLANAVNNLTPEETIKINDILAKLRMERYFQSVDEKPIQNVNNINGWYNRAKSYHSNPQEFERLYKHRVDDYIKNKYPQFYNGK